LLHTHFKPKLLLLAVLSTLSAQTVVIAEEKNSSKTEAIELGTIEVISTTPLKGIGLPLEHIPAAIQTVKEKDLVQQKSLSIADYINQNLTGVNITETQNNPYQPDVNFRGYTASPLLGVPQGLSVFVDGVRVNEPFGDVVNWDLISTKSINSVNLIPGSNPLFGLNTLGGALSVQTKSGRTNQGGAIETYAGSWGRKAISAEYGGVSQDGSIDGFISGNYFDEDGWRDFSPSTVKQIFTKIGWQNETTAINLSYTGADNKLIGNGLSPSDFINSLGRDSILTRPDITENKLSFLNLNLSHYFTDNVQLSGNAYYRFGKTKTLNGDGNDDFDAGVVDTSGDGDIDNSELQAANTNCIADIDADKNCSGLINRTSSNRKSMGFNAQLTFNQDLMRMNNQLIVGAGYDYGKTKFNQSSELGLVNATRGIDGLSIFDNFVELQGISKTSSIFATDTLSLNPLWHLTLSGRYNYTKVDNYDYLDPVPNPVQALNTSLTSSQSYNRFNPAIGLNYTPNKNLTAYASYNEGSRAPTAIELGCANPAQPCRLPNAFAGDPPLDQVVAKTFEGGFRGKLLSNMGWALSAYHAQNHNDIQFISSSTTGAGYFDNVGKTQRQGIDASLSGRLEKLSWSFGYSFIKATYESDFTIVNGVNTSNVGGVIQVSKGDNIPGIPQHQLKLRAAYDFTPSWTLGTNVFAFSDQYSRGNENNQDQSEGAKTSGYLVVNLDTQYNINKNWQLFAKVNNLFDKEYSSAGLLGEHRFDASSGQFTGNESDSNAFYAVGAPRAGWVGVRYMFGGKKSVATIDND
jgi:outer membrane receptor protein involved in Fe transport